MGEFTIEIAEIAVRVKCLFESTPEYCKSYITEKSPQYSLAVRPEQLVTEQADLDEEADREGLKRRRFTDPFLERAVIQRGVAGFALENNTILLHGSTVAVDGRAYLFTADCGVGKSTHTRFWQECFGDRAVMVNDDRAFLRIGAASVEAFGSPWSGKHGLHNNVCVPLAGICILKRGTENRIRRMEMEAALPLLMEQVFLPCGESIALRNELTARIAGMVPLWQMECTKTQEAALAAFEAMSAAQEVLP